MSIKPRALAVDGVGYKPYVLAMLGFGSIGIEIIVSPAPSGHTTGAPPRRRKGEQKPQTITFKVTYKDTNVVKSYTIKKQLPVRFLIKLLSILKLPMKIFVGAKEK